MRTTSISTENQLVTLINVFTVDPGQQQRLVDLLVKATDEVMRKQPGFLSANIHKSADGERVANYAQWVSRADFERVLANPEAQKHMKEIATIARFDAHLYEVVSVHTA